MSGKEDFSFKKISPIIGGGRVTGNSNKLTSSFDLVEQTHFLYVEIILAINCTVDPRTGTCDPFVEITLGNYKATTKTLIKTHNREWNQVFAFDKSKGDVLDIALKDKQLPNNPIIGKRQFKLAVDIPTRVPPDARIAPQWYSLGNNNNSDVELLMSVWYGTQADEVYSVAWHSDASAVNGEYIINTRPKVYIAPRLCYVRVNIISAHDLIPRDRNRKPEVYVKAVLGHVALKTKVSSGINPSWNEDLMFVAAEPLDDTIFISVMDRLDDQHEECIGKTKKKLSEMTPLKLPGTAPALFYNLELPVKVEPAGNNKFASKLRMRLSTDQAYHVFDEPIKYCSDYRAYVKGLWPGQLGAFEIGILGAVGLPPMKTWKDGHKSTDAYVVAKYGNKWVRTRTVVDSLAPKWNEQYTFDVYDPCTVVTIGVYDNCQLYGSDTPAKDLPIGKVRFRLSLLEACKIYTYSCPIIYQRRAKKMGEIQLAVRFSCPAWYQEKMWKSYTSLLLPKMHYKFPLSVLQIEALRQQAVQMNCLKLARMEPPLRKEVVEDMLHDGSNKWSMRRAKANYERLVRLFQGHAALYNWFNGVCRWKNPFTTILVHIFYGVFVWDPENVLSCLFLCTIFIVAKNYFLSRSKHPFFIDIVLSKLDSVHPDELDEELDTFPSSVTDMNVLRMRYDRLRKFSERVMALLGDIAAQLERFYALLTWQDRRATAYFLFFCWFALVVVYWFPLKVVVFLSGAYVMRHPYLRTDVPIVPRNLFRRLPTREDNLL